MGAVPAALAARVGGASGSQEAVQLSELARRPRTPTARGIPPSRGEGRVPMPRRELESARLSIYC